MEQQKKGVIPFFPHHFLSEMALAFAYLGLVLVLAGVHKPELGPPANPVLTPSHILPEWYFLWLFGLLRLVPRLVGLLIPGLVFAAIFLLPWLDRSPDYHPAKRPKVMVATLLMLGGMVGLTIVARMPW
ncbi:cytochrome b subunit of the bc complex [Desulforamulus ruminis]|uniref:Cytochrome b/b6 domain protein n=1 Tax=Desulforamulus ruminis (strain ATCC 23193 / DSM 2154 / NCIMB 8452 / DL) TaxID=696281 RepID=F6DRN0_DESRL|nr:cytochrome b subunit of the bc complex [Desulforamulus ruminis]AEG59791.1 Cytochrome b/b6 domain protein [Desulforamulus ruminis DSM 2154]